MARVAEQVVGRAAELAALDDAVAALEGGEPGALVLVGEPGIGKTRLLAELAARADARGSIVLSGSASELERDLPFWVFVDALDEYVAGLDPRRLALARGRRPRRARRACCPSLSRARRAGASRRSRTSATAPTARCATLLERLAATKPLVLVLDDVHWADSASIELLGALLRRPPAAAVLLALGARPRQLPERLAGALERARRDGRADPPRARRARARRRADGCSATRSTARRPTRLYEESGGNPFYLEQLARSPQRRRRCRRRARAARWRDVDVPPAVAARAGRGARAAVGRRRGRSWRAPPSPAIRSSPSWPPAAAAIDEAAAIDALDELLALDLVRPTDVPRRFRFRHPLVRRAVYEAAPGGWLLGAHERCADGARAARRRGGGARAPRRARRAPRATPRRSRSCARPARRRPRARPRPRRAGSAPRCGCCPTSAPPEERVELLLARAERAAATGRLEESRADLLESIDARARRAVAMRVRLTVACAGVEHMLGRYAERPRSASRRRSSELPDAASPEAVALMIVLAFDGLFRGDFDAMREAAERGAAAAPAARRPAAARAPPRCSRLPARWGGDDRGRRGRARDEAAALVDAMSDDELAGRIDAAAHLAAAELYLDRFDEAGRHAERALEVGRATGQLFPTAGPDAGDRAASCAAGWPRRPR